MIRTTTQKHSNRLLAGLRAFPLGVTPPPLVPALPYLSFYEGAQEQLLLHKVSGM